MANQHVPIEKRLWERLLITPGCWFWTGKVDDKGYGRIRNKRKMLYVHRVVRELYCGSIPSDKELDHLCRTRHCANPDHLEPVPHVVNVRRGEAGKRLSQRTHCKNGHPFDEANTIPKERGRGCRACGLEKAARYRLKDLAAYRAKARAAYHKRRAAACST